MSEDQRCSICIIERARADGRGRVLQNRMPVRLVRTPTRQVCNASAWVHPNNSTIDTTYMVLLRLLLLISHGYAQPRARCSSLAAGVTDRKALTGPAGCTGGPEGRILTGEGLWSGGLQLCCGVIGALSGDRSEENGWSHVPGND